MQVMASKSEGGDGVNALGQVPLRICKSATFRRISNSTLTGTIESQLEKVDRTSAHLFVEYCPGTGEFTRYILQRLPPDAKLIAIESENGLADHLRETIDDRRLPFMRGRRCRLWLLLGRMQSDRWTIFSPAFHSPRCKC